MFRNAIVWTGKHFGISHYFSQHLESIVTVVIAIAWLLLHFYFRNIYTIDFYRGEIFVYFPLGFSIFAAALFHKVEYSQFPGILATLTRVTALGVLFLLVFEPPDYTLADSAQSYLLRYVDNCYWIALGAALVSLWRPSYLFAASLYVLSTRFVIDDISGFRISSLDIRYMLEIAQFLSLSLCALAVLKYFQEKCNDRNQGTLITKINTEKLEYCIAFIAIGLNLGNYFWSGVEKLVVGPQLWTWAIENKTQNLMVVALNTGVLPTGAIPEFTQWLYDGFGKIVVVANLFTLFTQLFALFVVFRLRWLIWTALVYELFHAGIYFFGGVLFWPWIWTNASILFAVRGYSDKTIGLAPKLCCLITILLGHYVSLGGSAHLAWFDILDIKTSVVQAQSPEGNWVNVPVSYFLSHSFSISLGNLDRASISGHYRPTIWGSVNSYERLKTSGKCIEPPPLNRTESILGRMERIYKAKRFLIAHHRKMAERYESNLTFQKYYFRGHHHPSNPWLYSEFNALDIRDIEAYRLLTRSVCLNLVNGKLDEKVLKVTEHRFEVD
jgi:hypothetical protein